MAYANIGAAETATQARRDAVAALKAALVAKKSTIFLGGTEEQQLKYDDQITQYDAELAGLDALLADYP